jgi:hypothetical protein
MKKAALEVFGRLLMERVRDRAINDWEGIITGRTKNAWAEGVRATIKTLDPQQFEAVCRLIPRIVDTTLHHLLWTLEQEEVIDVAVRTDTGVFPSIRDASDGLAGELYDWIPRFSKKQPYDES